MAVFEGTVQEFHHFIGPRIRNAINNLTRTYRKDLDGVCENCGEKNELHSAHIHGSERRSIIKTVLSDFDNNGIVKCNIGFVEKKILEAHQPVENHFKFLCQSCHIEYDSKQKMVFSNGIKTIRRQPGTRDYPDNKRRANIVAYYLSKYGHEKLGYGNQGETFDKASEVLGVNRNTIKNARDYFDPHTGSHRRGWHQVPLPPQYRKIHDELNSLSEKELWQKVINILHEN